MSFDEFMMFLNAFPMFRGRFRGQQDAAGVYSSCNPLQNTDLLPILLGVWPVVDQEECDIEVRWPGGVRMRPLRGLLVLLSWA